MKIVDVWKQGSDVFVYCTGDEITSEFSCKAISTNGKTYAVSAFDVLTSLNGTVNAVLKLSDSSANEIQHGNFRIAN